MTVRGWKVCMLATTENNQYVLNKQASGVKPYKDLIWFLLKWSSDNGEDSLLAKKDKILDSILSMQSSTDDTNRQGKRIQAGLESHQFLKPRFWVLEQTYNSWSSHRMSDYSTHRKPAVPLTPLYKAQQECSNFLNNQYKSG